MNVIELKNNFHNLIDGIDNEILLLSFYQIIKKKATEKDGQLWVKLTQEERKELLLAYDESEKEENLISAEEIKNKHKKWL